MRRFGLIILFMLLTAPLACGEAPSTYRVVIYSSFS